MDKLKVGDRDGGRSAQLQCLADSCGTAGATWVVCDCPSFWQMTQWFEAGKRGCRLSTEWTAERQFTQQMNDEMKQRVDSREQASRDKEGTIGHMFVAVF